VQPAGPSPRLLDHTQNMTLSLGLNKIRITYKRKTWRNITNIALQDLGNTFYI